MDLKNFLIEYDINMSDISKISGLSKACIHHICNGKRKNISIDTAIRIQLATENLVTVTDLLGRHYVRVIAKGIDKRLEQFNKGDL